VVEDMFANIGSKGAMIDVELCGNASPGAKGALFGVGPRGQRITKGELIDADPLAIVRTKVDDHREMLAHLGCKCFAH
jgi:hypothetical protein